VPTPDYSRLEKEQVARLKSVRAKRDAKKYDAALKALGQAADGFGTKGTASLVPQIVEAVRARASVGEIANVLRERWGAYRPA
jgi:methylmalonyl-CoA mutase N-terminal domain/subunit